MTIYRPPPTGERQTVRVRVTRGAASRIRRRGGRLYLWNDPLGGRFVRDRVAFEQPAGLRRFECTPADRGRIEIWVADDADVREVRVEPGRWPLSGIRVYADGRRWGFRGPGESGL